MVKFRAERWVYSLRYKVKSRISYIAIILFLPFLVNAQDITSNEKVKIGGVIYDAKSSERIPFVHIIDISLNTGTSADDNGNFSFTTNRGDSIKYTAVGYSDYYMVLNDSIKNNSYQVIKLEPKAYLLESMDFYANDPMKGFYLKDIPRDTIRIGNSKGAPGAAYWNVLPNGGSGYITTFANLFNNRAKQEKKLRKILEEERMLKMQEEAEMAQRKTSKDKYIKKIRRE